MLQYTIPGTTIELEEIFPLDGVFHCVFTTMDVSTDGLNVAVQLILIFPPTGTTCPGGSVSIMTRGGGTVEGNISLLYHWYVSTHLLCTLTLAEALACN